MQRFFPPGLGLLALAACSPFDVPGNASPADPYYGFFDPSVLQGGFAAKTDKTLCPKGKCYPAQQGWVHGKAISFYNLFSFSTASLAASDMHHPLPISTLVTLDAYDFPMECAASSDFDPKKDAFVHDTQYPIFAKLPLGMNVYPFIAHHNVSNLSGNRCNDLKTLASIETIRCQGDAACTVGPGRFGATIDNQPDDYRMWTIIDYTANFGLLSVSPNPGTMTQLSYGWFNGLQLTYLDSGAVPTDSNGNFLAQDGVLVNPTGGTSKNTDAKAIILSKAPGEDGYSPIVQLHTFNAPDGTAVGDFTGICAPGGNCAQSDVLIGPGAFSATTIMIYAP
jgi:hypothetical protein